MVWMRPSGSTDSTMPMWRAAPDDQVARAAASRVGWIARPVRCAQPRVAATAPKPWPCSPSGAPACLAAQETK